MHFDNIIIGGGLAGLVCGLRLQRGGANCAIISSGQNAMHFSSGSFGLLSRDENGQEVENPLEHIDSLSPSHPYRIMGKELVGSYASQAKDFFRSAGINLKGEAHRNSRMFGPTGNLKTVWMGLEDVSLISYDSLPAYRNVLIANIKGYLDFSAEFIADGISSLGAKARILEIEVPELSGIRQNPSEMRSVNIAKAMENTAALGSFVSEILWRASDEELILLPAVFGLRDTAAIEFIKAKLQPKDVGFVGTMPPSIPGIRSQLKLKKAFEAVGGTMLSGDCVDKTSIGRDGKVEWIQSENFGDLRLEGERYILASGSFFSRGLISDPEKVYEPLFGLDIIQDSHRENWFDRDFFKTQNYLSYGAVTDGNFHPLKDGKPIGNLYAIGSVLGGYNPIELGCGAGTAIMTAFFVADQILHGHD